MDQFTLSPKIISSKNNQFKVLIPFLPPSQNKAQIKARGRVFDSPELKEFKRMVATMPVCLLPFDGWVQMDIEIFFPLYFKNGNVRRKDTDNYIKWLKDCMCERLIFPDDTEVDDCYVVGGLNLKKDLSMSGRLPEDHIVVTIKKPEVEVE